MLQELLMLIFVTLCCWDFNNFHNGQKCQKFPSFRGHMPRSQKKQADQLTGIWIWKWDWSLVRSMQQCNGRGASQLSVNCALFVIRVQNSKQGFFQLCQSTWLKCHNTYMCIVCYLSCDRQKFKKSYLSSYASQLSVTFCNPSCVRQTFKNSGKFRLVHLCQPSVTYVLVHCLLSQL